VTNYLRKKFSSSTTLDEKPEIELKSNGAPK